MSSAENGHEDTHAAEDERVEGAAEGPPGAEEQEDEEVHSRGQRGQHDTCEDRDSGHTAEIGQGFIYLNSGAERVLSGLVVGLSGRVPGFILFARHGNDVKTPVRSCAHLSGPVRW